MTLKQVDEVLRSWKRKLTSIAENLLDLQEDATFRYLTGTGGLEQAVVTGVTAARVKPALGMLPVIFEQFALLQATIDQAEKLRAELPALFGGEAKGRELQRLLFGPSIQLPVREVPLERRTLLNDSAVAIRSTPSELLAPMEQSFGLVRDAVSLVTHASLECLGRCEAVEQDIARLRGQQVLPSAVFTEPLSALDDRLAGVRELLKTDPLGAQEELRLQIEPALREVCAKRDSALDLRERFDQARARYEKMSQSHHQALAGQRQHSWVQTIASMPKLVCEDTLRDMRAWLTRLEQKCEDGAIDAVTVGLRNWSSALDRCVREDRDALAALLAVVEQRSELCGRLEALQAKAGARGLAQDENAKALQDRASTALHGDPTNLDSAVSAIAAYQHFLNDVGLPGGERSRH